MRRVLTRDGWLFLSAVVLLGLTRVALLLLPFNFILRRLNGAPRSDSRTDRKVALDRVRWGVQRATRIVPGAGHCLTNALVVQYLLAREGWHSQLRIGVAKHHAGMLKAHAWVELDDEIVFGVTDSSADAFARMPNLDRI
jgi:hypothetical protein